MSTKLRTQSDLADAMSTEFAWRKKELAGLKAMVIATQSPSSRDMRIRAAVTLLYAHWEGFIKNIGTLYVEFVANQRLKHNELSTSFLAVVIHSMVQEVGLSNKIKPCMELADFFRSEGEARSSLAWRSAVQTKSNLSSVVLKEIVISLGLDYSRFETKEKLLDEQLLNNRNNIAHGKDRVIREEEYIDLHGNILGMMQDFYNQIENATLTSAFRVLPATPVPTT